MIVGLTPMLTQYEMFFERQTGEIKNRGLWLLAVIRALVEDDGLAIPPSRLPEGMSRWEAMQQGAAKTAMRLYCGNQARAAEWLGISRPTLARWWKAQDESRARTDLTCAGPGPARALRPGMGNKIVLQPAVGGLQRGCAGDEHDHEN